MSEYRGLVLNWLKACLYPRPLVGVLRFPGFVRTWRRFARMAGPQPVRLKDTYPCLGDDLGYTPFDPHYFYQGAWLARRVADRSPQRHVDIGSSVVTISVLSAFVDVCFVDYRPLRTSLSRFTSVAGDIGRLPFGDGALGCVSCLHVIEHIGLGRYGDPLDPQGSIKAARELERIVAPGGRLYLSTPVGRERVCFNAHRVFAPQTIVDMFPGLRLVEFSYVGDDGALHEDRPLHEAAGLAYGCGLFVLEKAR